MKLYGASSPASVPAAHRRVPAVRTLPITLPGSIYLGTWPSCRTVLSITQAGQNQNFPFGGTAVLIRSEGLETVKQIETQLNQRNYEGF